MMAHPGKKLDFMGNDFGQAREWNEKQSLDWHLLSWEPHAKLHDMRRALGNLYKQEAALGEIDHHHTGFEWITCDDADNSVVAFFRRSSSGEMILCAFNFTPVPRLGYRLGAPAGGKWVEIFNSDASLWGGGNVGNYGETWTDGSYWQNRANSLHVNIPPLGAVYLKYMGT
jgi:1,4-alpha-glucan branching enzyme